MHRGRSTMLRWNPRQRAAVSETLRELANPAAAALVLGQFVGTGRLSWFALAAGAAIWSALVAFSVALLKGDQP